MALVRSLTQPPYGSARPGNDPPGEAGTGDPASCPRMPPGRAAHATVIFPTSVRRLAASAVALVGETRRRVRDRTRFSRCGPRGGRALPRSSSARPRPALIRHLPRPVRRRRAGPARRAARGAHAAARRPPGRAAHRAGRRPAHRVGRAGGGARRPRPGAAPPRRPRGPGRARRTARTGGRGRRPDGGSCGRAVGGRGPPGGPAGRHRPEPSRCPGRHRGVPIPSRRCWRAHPRCRCPRRIHRRAPSARSSRARRRARGGWPCCPPPRCLRSGCPRWVAGRRSRSRRGSGWRCWSRRCGHAAAAADRARLRRWGADTVAAVRGALETELTRRLLEVERLAGAELDDAVDRRRVVVEGELRALAPGPGR